MKRYALKAVKNTVAADHGVVTADLKIVEHAEGDWVKVSDVIALLDRIEDEDDSYYRMAASIAREVKEELA